MPASSHQWIVDSLHSFDTYDVGSILPPIFDAYARVFHPGYIYSTASSGRIPVSWREVARVHNRVAHPTMEWGSLVGTWSSNSLIGYRSGPKYQSPDEGSLPAGLASELGSILAKFTDTPKKVFYALWHGWADVQGGVVNAELLELPNRTMYVIQGSIENVTNPFNLADPRTANLWWPDDRKWCVATEIDLLTTYVGGSRDCVKAVLDSDILEAMPATDSQLITWDADKVNPLPDDPIVGSIRL